MARFDAAALRGAKGNAAVQAGSDPNVATDAAGAETESVEMGGRRNAAVQAGAAPARSSPACDANPPADDAQSADRRSGIQAAAVAAAVAEARPMSGDGAFAFRHLLRAQRAYAFDRAGHLTRVSRWIALGGLVTGGAVFAELGATSWGRYLLGVAIPIIAAAEVVFEFAKRAERWREIIRETDGMLTRLDNAADPDAELATLRADYDAIALPNEPLFHWARVIAHNVANREMGASEREAVSRWRSLTRNWIAGRPDI